MTIKHWKSVKTLETNYIYYYIKHDTYKISTFEFWGLHISALEHLIFKTLVRNVINRLEMQGACVERGHNW